MLKYISKGWMKSLIFSNPGGGATRLIFEWGVRLGIGTITVAMAMTKLCEKYSQAMTTLVKKIPLFAKKNAKKIHTWLHTLELTEVILFA